ncbi:hypothetical protein [Phenylobacterium sp.]|uniref:hypothetical protein n=1 Tax=Phenylobacterium sp. TaxID=1871053 RepID=UPI0025D5AC3B|nr:hypothetical protein [Phenylobacterium sp.]MCA6354477.1 hypothetical protein [Phenylobacterium sp.]
MNVHVNPADVWARAIIAAARVFGDDPVEAVVAAPERGGRGKRQTLPAACLGIAKVSGQPVGRVAPVLGLQPAHVRARKAHGGPDFRRAVQAAERAAQYALWRPEAAESVAGSASGDLEIARPTVAAMDADVMARAVEALQPACHPTRSLTAAEPPPHIARPHAPGAGPLSLANGYAFAPPFRPGPPPPTQCTDGRILARLAVAPGSPRVLASILDIKESFVALHLRNLAREGLVIAADLAPGQSDRDQAWRVA